MVARPRISFMKRSPRNDTGWCRHDPAARRQVGTAARCCARVSASSSSRRAPPFPPAHLRHMALSRRPRHATAPRSPRIPARGAALRLRGGTAAQEAMHHLRVGTTRALSLVVSEEEGVDRPWYSNRAAEKADGPRAPAMRSRAVRVLRRNSSLRGSYRHVRRGQRRASTTRGSRTWCVIQPARFRRPCAAPVFILVLVSYVHTTSRPCLRPSRFLLGCALC